MDGGGGYFTTHLYGDVHHLVGFSQENSGNGCIFFKKNPDFGMPGESGKTWSDCRTVVSH